ncbi:hypothetical protein [Nostoc sp.]|uniref:hypothetical protein n=1 Tax=Nostoc sp. TaxID=1180 RepID=UPI002FF3E3D7
MHAVALDGSKVRVSEDPDNIIANFLALILFDDLINQTEILFAPEGEGIYDYIYPDLRIHAYRATEVQDLPEYMWESPSIDISKNEVWVISALGFCYEPEAVVILGVELRHLIKEVKKLRSEQIDRSQTS